MNEETGNSYPVPITSTANEPISFDWNWTNVEKNVPLSADYIHCKQYLVFDGYIKFAWWVGNKWKEGDLDYFPHEIHPTHWMPLPEDPT